MLKTIVLILVLYECTFYSDNKKIISTILKCDESTLKTCDYVETTGKNMFQSRDKSYRLMDIYLVCPDDAFEAEKAEQTTREINRFEESCHNETVQNPYEVSLYPFHMILKSTTRHSIIGDSLLQGLYRDFKSNNHRVWDYEVTLVGFAGFDIESRRTILNKKPFVDLNLVGEFRLYKRGRRVETCADVVASNSSGFIFEIDPKLKDIFEISIKMQQPGGKRGRSKHSSSVCELFFRDARLVNFEISHMINSFYLKSSLTFAHTEHHPLDEKKSTTLVFSFKLDFVYGIDLDSRVLNRAIFARTSLLSFSGHLNSIAHDVFEPLRHIEIMFFDATLFRALLHRQGIEWIKRINSHVLVVDVTNTSEVKRHRNRIVAIQFLTDRQFLIDKPDSMFDEADFCLFVEFPFRQLVFVYVVPRSRTISQPTRAPSSGFCSSIHRGRLEIKIS